jgi:carboxyl-terminal processing protease
MKNAFLFFVLLPALILFSGCENANPTVPPNSDVPTNPDVQKEFDFCSFALSVFFIFQERLPANPNVYKTPLELYQSVKDPYTRYLNETQAQSLLNGLTTENGGIGILIDSVATGYVIKQVFKKSPGEKAGLLAGDTIQKADGVSLAGISLDSLPNYTGGPLGSTKVLTIMRTTGLVSISVILGTYLAPSVQTDSLDSNTAYIMLTIFSDSTSHPLGSAGEFADALDKTAWARYTLLDIRHNYGGALGQCVSIVSQFVSNTTKIINVKERDLDSLRPNGFTIENYLYAEYGQKAIDRKFYVLVDDYSASASELLVSCLKDRRSQTVKIVGTKTYGKGSGWTYLDTPQNALVTITMMLFTPIFGTGYNLIGITPDIYVDTTKDAKLVALDLIGNGGLGKKSAVVERRHFEWYRQQLLPKPWVPMCVTR